MNIMRTLVRIHHLKVDHMPDHAVLIADTVTAQHIARSTHNIECLATGIAFHDRGDLDRISTLIFHTP